MTSRKLLLEPRRLANVLMCINPETAPTQEQAAQLLEYQQVVACTIGKIMVPDELEPGTWHPLVMVAATAPFISKAYFAAFKPEKPPRKKRVRAKKGEP